jgi:cell wall assembly regulator SMI1
MVTTRGERPAAPVPRSWRRIEAWLDLHLPALKFTLRPGVSKKDLKKFERSIGRTLPEDVRESWLIHDGQGHLPAKMYEGPGVPIPESLGLFFGLKLKTLLDSEGSLSSQGALAEWTHWKELIEGEDEPGYWDEFDERSRSWPAGAIRRRYFHPGWVPLVTLVDVDYLGVDLDPGPDGVVGQVINFGRNEDDKYVLAASWAQFLEDFADELEAGNFDIDMDREFEEFVMRQPPGRLFQNYRAWSQAKLAPDFPGRR